MKKFFVTHYVEFPIYHPEDGGYYTAGRKVKHAKSFFSLARASRYALDRVADYDLNSIKPGEITAEEILSEPVVLAGAEHTKVIGEGAMIVIEQQLGSLECA